MGKARAMTNRFWKLTREEVTSMQEEAREAEAFRADIDRRCREATEVVCGRSDAMSVDAALNQFKKATEEERNAPVPGYIAPVKRWTGDRPEADAWYWDLP